MLLKGVAKRPDAILILGLSPEIEVIARQVRELGIKLPITSIEGFGLAREVAAFEGAWFVDAAAPHREFRERFRERYGREISPGVGHAYDSVMMVARALHGAESREDAARRFREVANFSGVVGPISVGKNGVIESEPSVKVIRNGKVELRDRR
jgi:branched-chain amino acid transport system substrate-binding protein